MDLPLRVVSLLGGPVPFRAEPAGSSHQALRSEPLTQAWLRMSYADFLQQFSRLDICNLTPDTLSSDEVGRWSFGEFEGMWRVGSTAWRLQELPSSSSGWRTWMVDDEPHDGEDGCTVLIGLMQKDARRERRFGRDLNSIGFAIYEVPDEFKGCSNVHLGPNVLLRRAAVARSQTFTNLREVCDRFKLPPGEYAIIPSTFEPHRKGSFILRVFTEKQAHSSPMEEDVNADVHEDSEISAFELQQILDKVVAQSESNITEPRFKVTRLFCWFNNICLSFCLSVCSPVCLSVCLSEGSDVKTDGFSLQTCRNIISLLDGRQVQADRQRQTVSR
ncbi:hypothetical protein L3Q82_005584 [Scortum barcoo]|uniref:Uncharacterized protein n=1 Tax=Scortum barcoo TaxID=214431 RepID=A0ACB8V9J6_9TELE|nr:hypothetical protein L3Q82_005584 [Scortum barcoo]